MPGSLSSDALGKRVVVQSGVPRWRAADGFPRKMDRAQLDQALQLLVAQLSHSGLDTSLELSYLRRENHRYGFGRSLCIGFTK